MIANNSYPVMNCREGCIQHFFSDRHCQTFGGKVGLYRWRKYSGLVFCKSRGNSGVTASTSRHWKPQESSLWRWFHIAGKCHTGSWVPPGCSGGLGLWVGLAGCRFLLCR